METGGAEGHVGETEAEKDALLGDGGSPGGRPVASDVLFTSGVHRGPSMYLAVFTFFGSWWLFAHLGLLLALTLVKGFYFMYPPHWQVGEVAMIAISYGLRRAQQALSQFGDGACNGGAMAASVALATPVLLSVGYFSALQVYVLQLEFAMGALSTALLTVEVLLAIIAGVLVADGGLERIVLGVASLLSVAALVATILPVFSGPGARSISSVEVALGLNLALATAGIVVAMVSQLMRFQLFLGIMLLDAGPATTTWKLIEKKKWPQTRIWRVSSSMYTKRTSAGRFGVFGLSRSRY